MADPKLDDLYLRTVGTAAADPLAHMHDMMRALGIVKVAPGGGGGGDGTLKPAPVVRAGDPFDIPDVQLIMAPLELAQGPSHLASLIQTPSNHTAGRNTAFSQPASTRPGLRAVGAGLVPVNGQPNRPLPLPFAQVKVRTAMALDDTSGPGQAVSQTPVPPAGSFGDSLDLISMRPDLIPESPTLLDRMVQHPSGSLVLLEDPIRGPLFDEPPPGDTGSGEEESPCRDLSEKTNPARDIQREIMVIFRARLRGEWGDEAVEKVRRLVRRDPDEALRGIRQARKDLDNLLGDEEKHKTVEDAETDTRYFLDDMEEFATVAQFLKWDLKFLDGGLKYAAQVSGSTGRPCPEILTRFGSFLTGENAKGNCQMLKMHLEISLEKMKSMSFRKTSRWGLLQTQLTEVLADLKKCPVPHETTEKVGARLADLYKTYRQVP